MERVNYERWLPSIAKVQDPSCVSLAQYFARFFVDQCQKNTNTFENFDEEVRHSIHNFPNTFTAVHRMHWQECYMFSDDVDYSTGNKTEQKRKT